MTLKEKKESEAKEEKKDYVHIERSYGGFLRAIKLPSGIDPDKITAKSKNGFLEIVIPLSSKASAHKIKVKGK